MNTSRVLTLLLVLVAVFVFVVAMFFFFGKKETKEDKDETTSTAAPGTHVSTAKVLNVVTYLPPDRLNQLKASLGESYLFDARNKSTSYEFNGVTVSVFSSELDNLPGYTKHVHSLPKPFKGENLVFDGETSHHFFEDPVLRLTSYMWFDTLLFLTLTTETEAEPKVKKYYHYTPHKTENGLKWDKFDRDPTRNLDLAVLGPKLDELNLAMGNVVALNLDEFVDAASGTYTTNLNSVLTTFNLLKRSSSQTGFVKVTHKLPVPPQVTEAKPFKVRKLFVSGTELTDLSLTNKPVAALSVFWWFNVPLLAELELQGGDKQHLSYNVDTNNWESEVVEKLRSKLFLLKSRLGDPLTLDLSRTPDSDQTYTTNGLLVRVSPGATSVSKDFKKYTHRFSSSSAHFVGSFVNAGTPQMGLPMVRLNEASAYYMSGVPVLLKLNLATAGSLSTKYRFYSNNGYGVWSLVNLTQETSTTEALLKKFVEEARKMVAENDKYVLDARMKSNYLSQGKLVKVAQEEFSGLQGFTLYSHKTTDGSPFKFEKFTVAGKDVAPSSEELLVGVRFGRVYWFMEEPLLLAVQGTTTAPAEGEEKAVTAEFNNFFSFNAEAREWKKVDRDLTSAEALKEVLQEVRTKLGTVTLNLANTLGEYTSGQVKVNVVEATPFDNDPPTSFTKRVHTLSVPFPVDNVKHYDFDLALAKKDGSHYHYAVPVNEPLLPVGFVVAKMEVYYFGEVPLHFVVHSTQGAPLRYSNSFRGTLWMKDEYSSTVSVADVLVALRVNLGQVAKLDVCKDVPENTQVTYKLKYLLGTGSTDVTLSKTKPDADGVSMVTHKLPEGVTLKFTNLTCGDKVMTGLDMDALGKVVLYQRNTSPLYVKTNSEPKFYVASGDGNLTRFTPPAETPFTDELFAAAATKLAKKLGKVFDVNVLNKQEYTLLETEFAVDRTDLNNLLVRHLHRLKSSSFADPHPFVVRTFKHGENDALFFPTGLQLEWFTVFYHDERPLYMQLKTFGAKPKFYHYVYDNGLWLSDGVYDKFDSEEVLDRLHYLQDGLGNQFSLDLAEDVDNPLFKADTVKFDLVPGFVKHTYKPVGLDYPLLLQNLTLAGRELNLPLADKHMNLFTAYSFRNNFLFFHVLSHDNKNLFFKANFEGGFVPVTFETFDDVALKNELLGLRSKLANQFSLELTKKESYPYHNFNVNVVKQTHVGFEGYDKYLHDLVDGQTSVPFKLVSVKDNNYVTNVPEFKELVYFAYVYMHEDTPLLLELLSSTKERSDYHYYYFTNNLGNWELLQNPTLGQLPNARVREVLEKSRNQLARTFKLDLARKFSYKFTNGAEDKFFLESEVREDSRVTMGFSLYVHTFALKKGKGATDDLKPPTAENLGGVTVLPPETRTPTPPPAAPVQTPAQQPTEAPAPGGEAGGQQPVVPAQTPVTPPAAPVNETTPVDRTTTPLEHKPAGSSLAPRAAVPTTEVPAASGVTPVEPPVAGQEVTPASDEPVLTTYETLLANALRGVNVLAGNLPVVGKVAAGNKNLSGFAVDTVFRANVYWWHDQFPAFVHLFNGVDHKYYAKENDDWVLAKRVEDPLSRHALGQLLSDVKATFVKPVEVDLDKSSDFDTYVKYVSDGLTLRVVPSYTFPDGFKGFTHFSATQYERAFKVDRLTLWGDVVVNDLPEGFVKSVTVFTDADLLPLMAEVEWSKFNNNSFMNKFTYFKNNGVNGWAVHPTDDNSQRLTADDLFVLLRQAKETLGGRVLLSLEKREDYNSGPLAVRVVKDPVSRHDSWNGFHKVRHEFTAEGARVLMLKHGDRVLRAHHVNTFFKAVDTFWYKNVLLMVKLTVAGPQVTNAEGPATRGDDTFVFFKNDYKEDLMRFEGPTGELSLSEPAPLLEELAAPFRDSFHLDVAERTLRNSVDFVKYVPALYVVDTSVPQGYARYNLYVLDHLQGVKLSKLLYHGRDFSTGKLALPEYNVNSVYAFTPVGHFSPVMLELHVRGPGKLMLYYYHLNQFGEWVELETGFRPLTHQELHDKLAVLSANLGSVSVVDLSKTEGSYYGLDKMDVTKFDLPGVRAYTKYLHKPHDGHPFTVSKFVNKGLVLANLPVLKVTHVAVYNTRKGRPLLLELRVGGKYKFFSSNSNGLWFEERLPAGDLVSALNRVYDEHYDVSRQTGDLVSLHLNTDFVREYVLSEGKVEDFDGAVAVPEEEPEPAPAPTAERLLPEDPAEAEADATRATPTLQGATRPVEPPSVAVTRSHVLNPVLYVESDKLSYTYPSYGKTVFVTRRDEMFHGYNVTVHKLPENEPFVLRRLVYLGTEFDMGLGNSKLLSATSFSFLHTPLVLKFVFEDGLEKSFSFNFPTQTWTPLTVEDLEGQLDRLNFEQNRMVVLDLAKDAEYDVFDQKLFVEKSTFAQYTRLTTKSKAAADSKSKRLVKRHLKHLKKVNYKAQLKAEVHEREVKLKELKDSVEEKKKVYEGLLADWEKVDSDGAATHKKLLLTLDAVVGLEKTVASLEKELELLKVAGNAERAKDTEKELEAKKTELNEKKAELAKLKPAEPEQPKKTPEEEKAAEAEALKKKQDALKAALDKLFEVAKPLKPAEPLKEPTEAEEKLTKVKRALAVAEKFKEAVAPVDSLKEAVTSLEELKNAADVVAKAKSMVVDAYSLGDALEALKDMEDFKTSVDGLKAYVDEAKKVKEALDLLKPVSDVTAEGQEVSAKFTSATEVNKSFKAPFANKKESFKALYENFLALKNKVEPYVLKEKAVYAFNFSLLKLLLYETKVETLSKEFDEAESFYDKFKFLAAKANNLLELNVTTLGTVTEDLPGKLKALVAASDELGEALKPEALKKLDKVLVFAQKLKDVEAAPAKLDEAVTLGTKLKDKFAALHDSEDVTDKKDATKVEKFVAFANDLRDAFTDVRDKFKLVYDFVKKLGLTSDDTNALDENLNKFNEANNEVEKLKAYVATFVDSVKAKESVTNETEKREGLFEAAQAFKSSVKTASFEKTKLDLADARDKVKQALAALKETLKGKATEEFKVGVDSAKELQEDLAVQVLLQEDLVSDATKRHDLYSTEVEERDSDDDGTVDNTLLFGFGGLRLNGKDLPSAGLPLGTHLHTFNAFFPTGFSKPLMVQLKYRESEDLDEPVLEELLAPPPADALTVPDRQTVPVVPAQGQPNAPQAPGPAGPVGQPPVPGVPGAPVPQGPPAQTPAPGPAPASTPAAAGVTGTVQKVTELLQMGLQHTGRSVVLEKQPVVTPAPAAGAQPAGPAAPQGVPTGPRGGRTQDAFVYPGRFFVWDDGVWKHFVPEGKGALKAKLDELKAKHALVVDLDLARQPGTRRMEHYLVDTDNFVVRRVLHSNAYTLTRGEVPNNLQGANQTPTGPNVVDLNNFDASVKFFPPFNYHWFLHHKAPTPGTKEVVDPLPAFELQGLNFNGVALDLDGPALDVLTEVRSVSALLNANGVPLLLLVYKPVQTEAAVQHNYVVLAYNGEKFVVDTSFGNFNNLLYNLEHTPFRWDADPAFEEFNALLLKKLTDLDEGLEPSYVVDLGAAAHYKKQGVVVNVGVSDAFGVRHVSYTPGLVPVGTTAANLVPAFVLEKVFLGETVFKGFKLPAKNVLHVTVFHWKFLHLLKEGAEKAFTTFPLFVEFSFRNEHNRLVHHYYQYVGGDRFELHSKTKFRLTAAEVADVVKNVAYNNLRVSNALPSVLNVDLSLHFTHYTPGHKLLVNKFFKTLAPPPATPAPQGSQPPAVVNGFVPDGYVLYKFALYKDDPGYTFVRLFFEKFWAHLPTKYNYKEYYAYVKDKDTLPVLVAMGYSEPTGPMKFDWLGLNGNKPVVLFDTVTVSPFVEADKPKVEAELNKLTANVDFWLEEKPAFWTSVAPGLTVKLSPVGGLEGFPRVKRMSEAPRGPVPTKPAAPAPTGTPQQPTGVPTGQPPVVPVPAQGNQQPSAPQAPAPGAPGAPQTPGTPVPGPSGPAVPAQQPQQPAGPKA